MSTRALTALVRKDLQLFFHDRRALLLSFVVPIAIASFFGFLFSGKGGDEEAGKIEVRVVDLDGTPVSKAVVKGLSGDPALAVTVAALDPAREAVRGGKAAIAVVLPAGFGQAAGRAFFRPGVPKPAVQLLHDPSKVGELGMVRGILTQHVMEAVSQEVFNGPQGEELIDESLRDLADGADDVPPATRAPLTGLLENVRELNRQSAGTSGGGAAGGAGLSMPFAVAEEPVTARAGQQYNGYAHSFGGMGVQFMLFGSIDLGVAILLERQRGLWKRLRSAPVSRGLLLASRALSAMLVATLTLLVSFGFAMAVFGVRIEGSWPGFLGVILASALMSATLGLLIAALGGTPQAARGVSTLVVLVVVMLGGAWVPAFIFPAWLQKVTLLDPVRWAVDGLDAMTWRGLGLADALLPIAVLLGFSLLFGLLAWTRFRWEEG